MKTRRRTLLPWLGGTSKSAAAIIARLPEHTTYIEPFCGGCAVLSRKPRSKAEVVNDTDSRLVTLLRVAKYHPDELRRELSYLTHSRQEFYDAVAQSGVTDIQRSARFLLIIKASFGSRLASPSFGYVKTEPANFTQTSATTTIAAIRARLEGVTIENLDFSDLIRRYESPGALFYCDPPYINTATYAEKFTLADHHRLRAALEDIKGKALVSLNDCPEARELYNGWQFQEMGVSYSVGGAGADRGKRNGEVLISKPYDN